MYLKNSFCMDFLIISLVVIIYLFIIYVHVGNYIV